MEVEVISAKIHTVVYENGEPIVQGNDVLLQNNITKDLLFSPLTPELCEEFHLQIIYNEVAAEGTNANQPGGAQEQHTKVWTKPNILYLIEKIKENDHEFSNGIKKNVWTKIATECEATFKQKVTPLMCETKWKTLKRTYKTIRLNNNSTGQKRRYWEYYNVMNEFLHNKPEITPTATCSSMSGLHVNEDAQKIDETETIGTRKEDDAGASSCSEPSSESSFSKKRKLKASAADRRHKEKMEKLDRFNDLFSQMLEKM